MICSHLASLLTVSSISLMPLSAQSASFNCNTADRPDEVLICQRPQLSSLDDRMASLYFTLRNRLTGAELRSLQANQTAWLQRRFGCGRDFECIERAYYRQIEVLLNW